jgi:pyruvate formate-lyase activating enzyme-like uncharacterized protein
MLFNIFKIKKTDYDSVVSNSFCKGCDKCLRGKKLVLFITGICSRNCFYCPLSNNRKNKDKVFANERECKIGDLKSVFEEIELSQAKGAGITGGDPLLKIERTIKYEKEIKKKYKDFHIHLYCSTKNITNDKLKRLSKVIDEIRFHPDLEKSFNEEKKKILLSKKYFNKQEIGIEIPIFPDKIKETLKFLESICDKIGFLNLNELEIGAENSEKMLQKYEIEKDGYVVKGSFKAGIFLLKKLSKKFPKLKIHFCSAKTKNLHQYVNRLKNYKILAFGKKTSEGTVIYFVSYVKNENEIKKIERAFGRNNCLYDKEKKRMILNYARVLKNLDKFKIYKIEEYPSFDRDEVEKELLN